MKVQIEYSRWYWCSLLTSLVLTGCADGPMPTINSMNPLRQTQWEADEQYQATLHRQLDEIAALQEAAPDMSGERQVHWSQEMAYILQHSDNILLRRGAVKVLAEFSVPQAAEGLRIAQHDRDAAVRVATCEAWGKRVGDESVEQLAEILGSDTDLDVRLAAARELGRFEDPSAISALGLALDDPDPALQYRAIESLRAASGRDFGNDLDAWRELVRGGDPGPNAVPSMAERLQRWF
jgi:hypothetical protein